MVETKWIETGCPPLSLSNESPAGARNGNFRCRDRATKSAILAGIQQQRLRKPKKRTHVFDISAVLRVSLSHHNYGEWVVETGWIETGCPPPSHRTSLGFLRNKYGIRS